MTPDARDAAWQARRDAAALGEPEPSAETPPAADVDPRWTAEEAFYAALAEASGEERSAGDGVDDAIIAAALEAVPVEPERERSRVPLAFALVAVAAAALVWVIRPDVASLTVEQGTWESRPGVAMQAGDVLPERQLLVATQAACLSAANAVLCATQASSLVVVDAGERVVTLETGAVRVESGSWAVTQAGEQHQLGPGDTLSVTRSAVKASRESAAGSATVPPRGDGDPVVEDPPPNPPPATKGETEEPVESSSERVGPVLSAAVLLERARQARGAGKRAKALRLYKTLLREHPRSAEAKAGRVTLGQLELERGRAKSAIRHFDAYLRGGGPLAEEAAWGRIEAIERSGSDADLDSAIAEFLETYPNSVYRGRARRKLSR